MDLLWILGPGCLEYSIIIYNSEYIITILTVFHSVERIFIVSNISTILFFPQQWRNAFAW